MFGLSLLLLFHGGMAESETSQPVTPSEDEEYDNCTEGTASEALYYTAKVIAGAAIVGTVAVAAPYVLLPALGFGGGGVVAGSVAAGWQATIGNVAGGSLFAALQSVGAAGGLSWGTTAAVGATGGVVGAVAGAVGGAAVADSNTVGS